MQSYLNLPKNITTGDLLLILIKGIEDRRQPLLSRVLSVLNITPDKIGVAIASFELKRLYINGPSSPSDYRYIDELLQLPEIRHSELIIDPKGIDSDPVRRYFESHLAYETLKENLHELLAGDLIKHFQAVFELLPEPPNVVAGLENIPDRFGNCPAAQTLTNQNNTNSQDDIIHRKRRAIYRVYVTGEKKCSDPELNEALKRLKMNKSGPYADFSFYEKYKMQQLIKIAFLSIALCAEAKTFGLKMGLKLYHKGLYKSENRGRFDKELEFSKLPREQFTQSEHILPLANRKGELCYHVKSHHLGIMKNSMPIPKTDLLFNDQISLMARPTDANGFFSSEWTDANFKLLVHPFCSSISGVMLAFIRVLSHLLEKNKLDVYNQENFRNLIRCFTSFFLFNSGGHSYHEFLSVLKLPEVKTKFSNLYPDNISNDYFLLENNEKAFDAALKKTHLYQQSIFKRRELSAEIKQKPQANTKVELGEVNSEVELGEVELGAEVNQGSRLSKF